MSYSHNRTVWSPEQEAYLREHFPTDAICDIADHLGFSAPVVSRMAKKLRLRRKKGFTLAQFRNRYVSNYRHGKYRRKSKWRAGVSEKGGGES